MIVTRKLQRKSCSITRQKNAFLYKILIACITAGLFSISSGTTVFAQELGTSGTQTTLNQTDDADYTDEIQIQSSDTAISSESSDTTGEDQNLTLEDGYYIGEDGQVYYDESKIVVEDPMIEDITEADEEEISEEVGEDQTLEDAIKAAIKAAKTESPKDTKKTENKTVNKATYSEADLRLLTCLVYAEAGGQSYKGMVAVANVVLNRVKSDVYWNANTIKEVVYDHKWAVQFSVTIKSSKTGLSPLDKALNSYDTGKYNSSMTIAIKAAKAALEGTNNIGNYLCFTNKRAASSIKRKYPDYQIIGDHIFYRTK